MTNPTSPLPPARLLAETCPAINAIAGFPPLEDGFDTHRRDRVRAHAVAIQRNEDVGEGQHSIAPDVDATTERKVDDVGAPALEPEERSHGAVGPFEVEEARRRDRAEGLA